MGLLRACLMEVRARREDLDSFPVVAVNPMDFSASGISEPSPLGRPLNLPEPLPSNGRRLSDVAAYIPA
jgi:hypothetical protein